MTGHGLCARCDSAFGEDPHWDPSLGEEVCHDCCPALTCLPLSALDGGGAEHDDSDRPASGDHSAMHATGAVAFAAVESSPDLTALNRATRLLPQEFSGSDERSPKVPLGPQGRGAGHRRGEPVGGVAHGPAATSQPQKNSARTGGNRSGA